MPRKITVDNYAGLESASAGSFLLPITHVIASEAFKPADLETTLADYSTQDDVWSSSFASGMFTACQTSCSRADST
jgi:hypothetical protein